MERDRERERERARARARESIHDLSSIKILGGSME